MLIADMTGDGILDVILATPYNVYIYKNTKGKKTGKPPPARNRTELHAVLTLNDNLFPAGFFQVRIADKFNS